MGAGVGATIAQFLQGTLEPGSVAAYLVFMAAAAIFGAAIVLLDALAVSLGGRSYLRITHGWHSSPVIAFKWAPGSVIASGIGLAVRIFEPTPLAAVVAAFTWRTFLGTLHNISGRPPEDVQN